MNDVKIGLQTEDSLAYIKQFQTYSDPWKELAKLLIRSGAFSKRPDVSDDEALSVVAMKMAEQYPGRELLFIHVVRQIHGICKWYAAAAATGAKRIVGPTGTWEFTPTDIERNNRHLIELEANYAKYL